MLKDERKRPAVWKNIFDEEGIKSSILVPKKFELDFISKANIKVGKDYGMSKKDFKTWIDNINIVYPKQTIKEQIFTAKTLKIALAIFIFSMVIISVKKCNHNNDIKQQTPQYKAETTIENYVINNLKDPSSYKSISWSDLKPTSDGYIMTHRYSGTNSFGATVTHTQTFYLNNSYQIIDVSK